jgi:hypothetical protein
VATSHAPSSQAPSSHAPSATTATSSGPATPPATAPWQNLTLVINYNLLASCEEDIDEALMQMYNAYWGNLSHKTSAVLVSATSDAALKHYELRLRDVFRAKLRAQLMQEGARFARGDTQGVPQERLDYFWCQLPRGLQRADLQQQHVLEQLCAR